MLVPPLEILITQWIGEMIARSIQRNPETGRYVPTCECGHPGDRHTAYGSCLTMVGDSQCMCDARKVRDGR